MKLCNGLREEVESLRTTKVRTRILDYQVAIIK
jgi:hypothetical protein